MKLLLGLVALAVLPACAQEASSGFELRTTVAAGGMYSQQRDSIPAGAANSEDVEESLGYRPRVTAGFRMVAYPLWKINRHWSIGGALQLRSRPYFTEDFETEGYGVKADLLQANIAFSQFWKSGSLVVRAGILPSAFGSYLLHYDDAQNALIDKPLMYGYYFQGVSTLGLAGVQTDLAMGGWDLRAQLTSSSPANRLGLWDHDQYANWAGGAGYTVRQGLRVGSSVYRGPYLNRTSPYFVPGEGAPVQLPATAFGVDMEWARGHWNAAGEWQRFVYTHHAIPTEFQHSGYSELRRVLHPRWSVAARLGYAVSSREPLLKAYEFGAAYRAGPASLIKISYQVQRSSELPGTLGNTLAVQVVHTLRLLNYSRE